MPLPSSLRSRWCLPGSHVAGLLGAALGLAVATAQTTVPENTAPAPADGTGGDESGGLFSGGLLPNGSILKNVVLPSYDAQLHLLSTVNAGDLTIFTREEAGVDAKSGKTKSVPVLDKVDINSLRIRFFNLDRSLKGNIAMSRARLEVRKKITLLTSEEPVSFVSDDLKVDGTALAFDTKNNRGFLHGPVTAVAKTKDKRTSMNASPAHRALAAGATMMMAAAPALPAQEAAPATETSATTAERFNRSRLTQAELDQLASDTASRAPQQVADSAAAGKDLDEATTKAQDARLTMNNFLQAASLASMLAEPAPAALPDVPRPPVFADAKETVVKSKNGAYFDSKEGLLIFLGDVTVKSPELDLSGASEVKVFMDPEKEKETAAVDPNAPPKPPPTQEQLDKMREAKEKANQPLTPEQIKKAQDAKAGKLAEGLKNAAKSDVGGAGGKFGDVKRLVATGPAVRIRYSSGKPDKAPVEASAHTVIYDFEKHQILLQGGSPWVYQEGDDGFKGQSKGPNAYILVYTDDDGNLTKALFENQGGGTEINMKTPEKKDDKKQQQPKPKQAQPNR